MYNMAIMGTTTSLNLEIRLMPPHIIINVEQERIMPIRVGDHPNDTFAAIAMVLDCTELNASPKVKVISMAKMTANHRLFVCSRPGLHGMSFYP